MAAGSALRPVAGLGAAPAVQGSPDLTVKKVDRIWLHLPFKPRPKKHMYREFGHRFSESHAICKVTLGNGVTGVGDGAVAEGALENVMGRPAAEWMWEDRVGSGLQRALFDAVARSNDVPLYRLLGPKVRNRAFMSWWAKDMPGEDWAAEAKEAMSMGYTAMKAKARAWFDLDDQCRAFTPHLPDHFKIDFDFNSLLLDAGRAIPYLTELEKYKHIGIYETPIPQGDVEGNRQIRQATRIPIAMHYGNPPIMTALRQEVCDGFVIGGGATGTIQAATVTATANKSFWLQLTGTGLTAAWAMHLAAVLTHARWPAITLHHLYQHNMVDREIRLENGTAKIPEESGLGYELNEDAVERYRVEQPPPEASEIPEKLLLAIRWPSGATSYFTDAAVFRRQFLAGHMPVFAKGVYLEQISNDGSREWRDLQARAHREAGVHSGGRPM